MTSKIKQGMHLRQPENSSDGAWIFQTLAAMLACAALMFALAALAGFRTGNLLPILLAAGGYVCIAYGVTIRFQKQQWFFLAALAVLLLLVLICRQQVLEGYRLFWNQMRNTYTAGTGWVLPEWETQLPAEKSGLCLTLFAVVAASAIALICCWLSGRAPAILAVLLPAAALAGMAVFKTDEVLPGLAALAAAVLILTYSGWQSRKAAFPVTFGWILCGIAAGLLMLCASVPGVQSWTQKIGEDSRKAIHAYRYETKNTVLPEGDFTDYQKQNGTRAGLEVTMSNPEALYLRGFTGATLEGDIWSTVDSAVLAQNQALLYWLNENAFHPAAQYASAAAGTDRGTGSVSIQNIGACSAYQYIPFSLRDTGNLPAENLKEDSPPSDGERTYRYSVVTGGENGIEQTLSRLQTTDDAQVLQYRRAESAYRSFVYRNYLQVPESVTQLLGQYWDETTAGYGSRENLTLPQAQACTLTFLSRCFPEEGTPEDMELPLTAAEGTSFQYATVAVMTLRYFGIPARYAEGYVISEEMAADAQAGEPLTVDSRCARGWAEVYQDGIGWIPMELTPGLGEMLEQKPEENPDEGDSDNAESETQPEEETTPEEDGTQEPEPDGGTVTKIAKAMLLGVLWVLLIVLLLFLLLLLRRKLIRKRREQKYQLEDINEAVCWIFADTAALMEKLGLRRGNGSMRALCEPAKQRFGDDYATALAEAIRLNDRAMFSSHALTQEQRESALKFYADTQGSLKKNVKWYHRVWIKWIQCLY